MKNKLISDRFNFSSGQLLLEVMIAIGIGALLIGAAIFAITFSLSASESNETLQRVTSLVEDETEKVKAATRADWLNLYNLNKGLTNHYYAVPVRETGTSTVQFSVTVDAVSTSTASGSSVTMSHTTSGVNRLLYVGISLDNEGSETVSSVAYNGIPLTFLGSATEANNIRVEVWYLVDPPLGTHNLTVTFSADLTRNAAVGAVTFTGVDQNLPFGSLSGNQASTGTVASTSVSSTSTEVVVDTVGCEDCASLSAGSGQSVLWNFGGSFGSPEAFGGASIKTGSSTTTMSWNLGSSAPWAITAVPLKPAAASSTFTAGSLRFVSGEERVIAREGQTLDGLVGYWKMDEPSGTVVADSSGSGINGTSTNASVTSGCIWNYCRHFNGVDSEVDMGDVAALELQQISGMAWVNAEDISGYRWIMKKGLALGQGQSASNGYHLRLNNGFLELVLYTGSDNERVLSGNTPLQKNTWYLVGFSYDGATARIYVNGILDGEAIYNEAIDYQGEQPEFKLGIHSGGGVDSFFQGLIDDSRVYSRSLSSDEFRFLANPPSMKVYFATENVCRDHTGVLTGTPPCAPGASLDPSVQKVTVTVEREEKGVLKKQENSFYLTRWRNRTIWETDWSGGPGEEGPLTAPNTRFSTSTENVFTSTIGFLRLDIPVTHAETVFGTSTAQASVTSSVVTAEDDQLYLAAVTVSPDVSVSSVQGLGLSWTLVRAQCGARGSTRVEVWEAQGAPSGNGPVTAVFSATPSNAAIAVSRYAGVNFTDPVGAVSSRNTLGQSGACSGGSDTDSPFSNITTVTEDSFLYGAFGWSGTAVFAYPGPAFTGRGTAVSGVGAGTARTAVEDRPVASPEATVADAKLEAPADWAVIAVEIKD